jgi:hypothetical protein
VDDQPSNRHRYDCAQYRKANPESKGLAPHRITDAQQLWAAGPLNHSDRIGNFFFKLYRATPQLVGREEGRVLGFWPNGNDDVSYLLRPSVRFDPAPLREHVGTDRLAQRQMEIIMAHRLVMATDHHPAFAVALDDQSLPRRRVTLVCDRTGRTIPLGHVEALSKFQVYCASLRGADPCRG